MDFSFGAGVKKKRTEHGLSQQKLADACWVSQACIASIESGARIPSFPLAYKIAEALGTTIDELIKG